jgi:hypothetical protein
MKSYQFPLPAKPHVVYVKDRARNSGLTSLRFFGDNRIVCCDFNGKIMYLVELTDSVPKIIAYTPTVIQDGTPVQTDLMDVNKEGLVVVSNFYQGSQSFFQIKGNTLAFVGELDLHPSFRGCHGVRFVPGYDDLLWVTYCGTRNKYIVILNYKTKTVLHEIPMPEQLQDAAFVGPYAVVPARTDHITVAGPNATMMYATIYLFRLPENLYTTPPTLIDTWHGNGHLDAMIEYGDQVYSANQYTDEVDVFGITSEERIELRSSIKGFSMPHGLDIRLDGLMAVTNYEDSSLRLVELAPVSA